MQFVTTAGWVRLSVSNWSTVEAFRSISRKYIQLRQAWPNNITMSCLCHYDIAFVLSFERSRNRPSKPSSNMLVLGVRYAISNEEGVHCSKSVNIHPDEKAGQKQRDKSFYEEFWQFLLNHTCHVFIKPEILDQRLTTISECVYCITQYVS